eukprot:scaffold124254_cov22-Tisochrysis_lutea.AAC.1
MGIPSPHSGFSILAWLKQFHDPTGTALKLCKPKLDNRLSVEPTNGPCHTSMYPPEIGQNGPGGAYVQLA